MRVLLDECVDSRLADHIRGHSVATVAVRGWGGISNGELLALAQAEFDVFDAAAALTDSAEARSVTAEAHRRTRR